MHFSEVEQQFSEQYMHLLAGSVALLWGVLVWFYVSLMGVNSFSCCLSPNQRSLWPIIVSCFNSVLHVTIKTLCFNNFGRYCDQWELSFSIIIFMFTEFLWWCGICSSVPNRSLSDHCILRITNTQCNCKGLARGGGGGGGRVQRYIKVCQKSSSTLCNVNLKKLNIWYKLLRKSMSLGLVWQLWE